MSPILAALVALTAAQTDADASFHALADAYIAALGTCDEDAFKPLLSDDHRRFVIQSGEDQKAPDLYQQCEPGYRLKVEDHKLTSLEQAGGFGSALLELRTKTTEPSGREIFHKLRISLMMEDRGDGPQIVRSHIAALR